MIKFDLELEYEKKMRLKKLEKEGSESGHFIDLCQGLSHTVCAQKVIVIISKKKCNT